MNQDNNDRIIHGNVNSEKLEVKNNKEPLIFRVGPTITLVIALLCFITVINNVLLGKKDFKDVSFFSIITFSIIIFYTTWPMLRKSYKRKKARKEEILNKNHQVY